VLTGWLVAVALAFPLGFVAASVRIFSPKLK